LQIKTKMVICHTADSKPVKQEVNGTVMEPFSIPWLRVQAQPPVLPLAERKWQKAGKSY
jgi:hypothetical protein